MYGRAGGSPTHAADLFFSFRMAKIELHSFIEGVKEEEPKPFLYSRYVICEPKFGLARLIYCSTGFRFWKVSLPPMNQYKGMDDGFSKVGKPVQ